MYINLICKCGSRNFIRKWGVKLNVQNVLYVSRHKWITFYTNSENLTDWNRQNLRFSKFSFELKLIFELDPKWKSILFFQNFYFRVYSGFASNNNPDFETQFTKCFRANWVKLVTRTFSALWKNLFQRCLVISFSLSS